MQDIMSLMDDLTAMDALADQLIQEARPGCGSAETCQLLLRQFQSQLASHLEAEARLLLAVATDAEANPLKAELRALQEDFAELSDSWTSYLGQWTEAAIDANRASFLQQTSDMMTAFKLRIARKNKITYPLALEAGRIALHPEDQAVRISTRSAEPSTTSAL